MPATDTQPKAAGGPFTGYAEPEDRPPFKSYASFAAILNASVAGALIAARRNGRDLPARASAGDVVLMGVASHKISRLVSKDKVTAFARAPFTEFQARGGPAEVEERARGTGLRRALGELLICPYCLGLWVAAGLHVGLIFAPRTTRFVASVFGSLTISDFLQIGYKAAEDRGLGGS